MNKDNSLIEITYEYLNRYGKVLIRRSLGQRYRFMAYQEGDSWITMDQGLVPFGMVEDQFYNQYTVTNVSYDQDFPVVTFRMKLTKSANNGRISGPGSAFGTRISYS